MREGTDISSLGTNKKVQHHHTLNVLLLTKPVLLSKHTLFFSSFCFCRSSRAARRFSALIRCSSSFLRRPSSCCSLSCRAFSSFSSHWVFLAAKIGQKTWSRGYSYAKRALDKGDLSLFPVLSECCRYSTHSLWKACISFDSKVWSVESHYLTHILIGWKILFEAWRKYLKSQASLMFTLHLKLSLKKICCPSPQSCFVF